MLPVSSTPQARSRAALLLTNQDARRVPNVFTDSIESASKTVGTGLRRACAESRTRRWVETVLEDGGSSWDLAVAGQDGAARDHLSSVTSPPPKRDRETRGESHWQVTSP